MQVHVKKLKLLSERTVYLRKLLYGALYRRTWYKEKDTVHTQSSHTHSLHTHSSHTHSSHTHSSHTHSSHTQFTHTHTHTHAHARTHQLQFSMCVVLWAVMTVNLSCDVFIRDFIKIAIPCLSISIELQLMRIICLELLTC